MKNFFLKTNHWFAMVLIALVFASCAASVEGETDKWNSNKAMMENLITERAGYAEPLESVKSMATNAWESANEVSDEEKKIEALQAANRMIDNSFAQKLYDMPGMIKEIGRIREKLAGKTMSKSLISKLNSAASYSNDAVFKAENVLGQGAEDLGSAEDLVGPVYTELRSATDKWKSLKKQYDNEKKKKKKKKK